MGLDPRTWFGGSGDGNEESGWATAAGLIPGMAGPILQFGGASAANNANRQANWDATNTNKEEAQRNRDFQERMSNSAWQRATKDMSAAGINPMLAVSQGPASSPSGSTGSAATPKFDNSFQGAAQMSASALDAVRLGNELKSSGQARQLAAAQTTTEETKQALNIASANETAVSQKGKELSNEALNSKLIAIKEQAKADAIRAKYDQKFGDYDAYSARIGTGTGIISDAAGIATGGALGKIIKGLGGRGTPRPNKNWGTFDKKTGEIYE